VVMLQGVERQGTHNGRSRGSDPDQRMKVKYGSGIAASLTHEQREGGDARQRLGLGRAHEDKVAVRLEEAEVVVEGHGWVV
jgi:hypothetical protein